MRTAAIKSKKTVLSVSSPDFKNMGPIPYRYTRNGLNVNPALRIKGLPAETKSMVLIMEDPDAPRGTWTHWLVWNIPPVENIEEDSVPGITGRNDFNTQWYEGPCPPTGTHRYFFRVFALNKTIDVSPAISRVELEKEIAPFVVAYGELTGTFASEVIGRTNSGIKSVSKTVAEEEEAPEKELPDVPTEVPPWTAPPETHELNP